MLELGRLVVVLGWGVECVFICGMFVILMEKIRKVDEVLSFYDFLKLSYFFL